MGYTGECHGSMGGEKAVMERRPVNNGLKNQSQNETDFDAQIGTKMDPKISPGAMYGRRSGLGAVMVRRPWAHMQRDAMDWMVEGKSVLIQSS